jgi:2-methylisocitrate lyase-like PEP mutase family enzyme
MVVIWHYRFLQYLGAMTDRCRVFRELHRTGCFVLPNPWDVGSARALEKLGFRALATTSCGFAWSVARADNQVTLDQAVEHFHAVASSVSVPVNADFEGGFAVDADAVGANVSLVTATGVAGVSIEDSSRDVANPLFDFDLSVARIQAARQAIDESGTGVVLTGRSEGFLVGRPDLAETIRRLVAYADAGADCLYAPRLSKLSDVAEVIAAVAPRPVNVLVGSGGFTTLAELTQLGARRISVGGALARAAWAGFFAAAREIAEHGTFESLSNAIPYDEVNEFFRV